MRHPLIGLALPILASGLSLGVLHPPALFGWLAWVALVPLLVVACRVRGARQALAAGWAAASLQCLLALRWIPGVLTHYGGIGVPLAWLLFMALALMLGAFPAAVLCLSRAASREVLPVLLLVPFGWVAMEVLLSWVPFGGFPWLLMGYTQTDLPWLAGIAGFTGAYGVSFLVILVNCAVAGLFLGRSRALRLWFPLGTLILLSAGLGAGRTALWKDDSHAEYSVAMLQANISMDEPEDARARKFLDGYTGMADRLPAGTVDLLLIPESPSPMIFQFDLNYREAMRALARRYPLGLILSNIGFEGNDYAGRYFNSAYFLGPDGSERGRYDKVRLVPFGEYVPLKRLFFFTESVSKDVGAFSPGQEPRVFPLGPAHRAGTVICFEAAFPQLCRSMVARGAEVLVNLSNDGWFGDTAAPYQHLNIARWRALENRRFLLRSTNSGVSAVIRPDGAVMSPTGLLKEGICIGRFHFSSESTFYSRHGDVFGGVCAMIFVLSAGAAWLVERRARPTVPGGANVRGNA